MHSNGVWCDHSAEDQVCLLVKDMCRLGVVHGDIRIPNILRNQELQQAMLVHFERASVARFDQCDKATDGDDRMLREMSINLSRKRYNTGMENQEIIKSSITKAARFAMEATRIRRRLS
jgi:hypothetical protein